MYEKLLDILLESSLRNIVTEHEIEEIAIELEEEFKSAISEKVEEIKDQLSEETSGEIAVLKTKIKNLETRLSETTKTCPPLDSLQDVMAMEWAKENWQTIITLYKKS